MKKEELEQITNSISDKLGKETSALIHDDLASIILDNEATNKSLTEKDNTIQKLKEDKESLIITNNKLFQQVGIGKEEVKKPEPSEEYTPFNFNSVFDEKGNFIN